jgi:hypothetical protein
MATHVAKAHGEAKQPRQVLKNKVGTEADFPRQVRSDRSTKITYVLAGAMLGAILTGIFRLLRQRAARATAGEQMGALLERVTS